MIPKAFLISWSLNTRLIASLLPADEMYSTKNLDNKVVSHLGHSTLPGGLNVIEWAGKKHPNYLAAGNIHGWIQTWDATRNSRVPTQGDTFMVLKGRTLRSRLLVGTTIVMAVGADEGLNISLWLTYVPPMKASGSLDIAIQFLD